MAAAFDSNFSFNQQLWYYYTTNRGKIRSRYNDLTRKFLAYNDSEENPHAFLRKPQFEALEMYVFVKEFMNNKQVYEMFDDWRNRRDRFSDASYYAVDKGGQIRLFDAPTEKQTDTIFKQMKKYREDYPNYIVLSPFASCSKTPRFSYCGLPFYIPRNRISADCV